MTKVDERLVAEAERLARSEPPRAASLVAQVLARGRRGTAVDARAAYVAARVAVDEGRLDDAIALLDRAADSWTASGDRVAALRTTLGRMHALDDLGRHHDAVAVADAALAELDASPEHEPTDATAWLRAALRENRGVALGYLGRSREAAEAAAAACEAWRQVDAPEDLARASGNLGVELLELGRARDAVVALEEAVVAFRRADDAVSAAAGRAHLARARWSVGDVVGALDDLDAASAELDELGASVERDRAVLQRCAILVELGASAEAVDELEELVRAAEADRRGPDAAQAAALLSAALLVAGRPDEARRRALATTRELRQAGRRKVAVATERVAAEAWLALGRPDRAATIARRLVNVARSSGWVVDELRLQLLAARADLAASEAPTHDVAQVRLRARALGLLDLEAEAAFVLGSVARSSGHVDRAVVHLRDAAELLELAQARLPTPALHARFLAARPPAHQALVRALLERGADGDEEEAAAVVARVHERTMLARRAGGFGAGTPDEVVDLRDQLLAEHGAVRARLETVLPDLDARPGSRAGTGSTEADVALLADLAGRLRRLELRVGPRGRGGASRGPTPRSVSRASGAVPSVTYHVLDDEVVGLVAGTRSRHLLRGLAGRTDVEALAARLDAHWRRAGLPGLVSRHAEALAADADRDLRELARLLLDPVLDVLGPVGRLAIVSQGALAHVPFAALPLDDGVASPATRTRLMDRIDVQHAATPLQGAADEHERNAREGVAVVGVDSGDTPAVVDEVRAVTVAHGAATVALGAEATVDALRNAVTSARLVHVAGHALHDATHPGLSGIQLADRWASAEELALMGLRGADLVLSGCDTARRTGVGTLPQAGGLVGSLLGAGARAVVASLWAVDDATTALLMADLHRAVARGSGLDQALASAQRAARRRDVHPHRWAAFTCSVAHPVDLSPMIASAA